MSVRQDHLPQLARDTPKSFASGDAPSHILVHPTSFEAPEPDKTLRKSAPPPWHCSAAPVHAPRLRLAGYITTSNPAPRRLSSNTLKTRSPCTPIERQDLGSLTHFERLPLPYDSTLSNDGRCIKSQAGNRNVKNAFPSQLKRVTAKTAQLDPHKCMRRKLQRPCKNSSRDIVIPTTSRGPPRRA